MTIPFLVTLAAGTVLAQTPPLQLRVSMISLGVTDPDRSIKFYGETLGLQMVGKPGEVTLFRAGDIAIALNHPVGRTAGDKISGTMEIIFPAESVEAAYSNLVARGCKFLREPREVFPGTWGATFTDPDGHRLTILGPR